MSVAEAREGTLCSWRGVVRFTVIDQIVGWVGGWRKGMSEGGSMGGMEAEM